MGEAMTWRPIETAPKGDPKKYGIGPRVLLARGREVFFGNWNWHANAKTGAWRADWGRNEDPTHWAPEPAPPDAARSTEEGE